MSKKEKVVNKIQSIKSNVRATRNVVDNVIRLFSFLRK